MTRLVHSLAIAVSLATLSVPAFAQQAKVLRVPKGVCTATLDSMKTWAATAQANGAVAIPIDTDLKRGECNSTKMVTLTGISGRASLEEAKAAAMEACEASRPDDLGPCFIFGELVLQDR